MDFENRFTLQTVVVLENDYATLFGFIAHDVPGICCDSNPVWEPDGSGW